MLDSIRSNVVRDEIFSLQHSYDILVQLFVNRSELDKEAIKYSD